MISVLVQLIVDLVEAGANLDAQNDEGNNILILAINNRNLIGVIKALRSGIDPFKKNLHGKNALEISEKLFELQTRNADNHEKYRKCMILYEIIQLIKKYNIPENTLLPIINNLPLKDKNIINIINEYINY